MTWSFVFNDMQSAEIPEHLMDQQGAENPSYPADIRLALSLAKDLGLSAGAITGFRMVSPYGDDEVVDVSVRGRLVSHDFVGDTRRDITAGPDGA